MKDARSEAQKEIEDYKKDKEAEYQKFEKEVGMVLYIVTTSVGPRLTTTQHSSGNKKAEDDAKKDTDSKVKDVEELGKKSGSKVVEQLINAVTNANSKPPRKG